MLKRRDKLKKIAKGVLLAFAIYMVAYVVNSASGGYWMIPGRDGHVRFKPEFGGLSMTVAIMWQPRFGHNALGHLDFFGAFFGPLIALDRAWVHPTHNLTDDDFDAWLNTLPASKVHPMHREKFVGERAKTTASGRSRASALTS
jgi:hypothetical protein